MQVGVQNHLILLNSRLRWNDDKMPRISIFFGIVIYMYYDDHSPPHFHAMHEGLEAVFELDGKSWLQGQ
jgi:hypothetical protein